MSSGSPDRATQRNGPLPSQNSGRMYSGTKPGILKASPTPASTAWARRLLPYSNATAPRACIAKSARTCSAIEVAGVQAALDAGRVDVDAEEGGGVHGGGQRLGAAHAAEARGQHQPAGEGAAEVAAGAGGEGLVGALEDALRADVDPRAGGH